MHYCRHEEAQKRKDRSEAHLYMYINVLLEDVFHSHHGHDLFDIDKSQDILRRFKVKKSDTVSQLIEMLAETLVSVHCTLVCIPMLYFLLYVMFVVNTSL